MQKVKKFGLSFFLARLFAPAFHIDYRESSPKVRRDGRPANWCGARNLLLVCAVYTPYMDPYKMLQIGSGWPK